MNELLKLCEKVRNMDEYTAKMLIKLHLQDMIAERELEEMLGE